MDVSILQTSIISKHGNATYAAAAATDLLNQGWPLLDQVEEKNDQSTAAIGESALYKYAEDFLGEARPPEGTFNISVNGSIDPQVGDYLPGDWCSIIVDDDFVLTNLHFANKKLLETIG